MSAYAQLERRAARLTVLGDAIGILDWDNATMMPDGAATGRAEQLALLREIRHAQATAPDLADLVGEAESEAGTLTLWQRANLAEIRRQWLHDTAVPADLVVANSRATSKCEILWRSARQANDFEGLRPHLEEVVRLQREIAAAKGAALGLSPYDALMDQYEPGARSAEIGAVFEDLAAFLPGFVQQVIDKQAKGKPILPLTGTFPIEKQRDLGLMLMKAVGFDFARGRLDVSAHPFCGGATGDVRITTRYSEDDCARALMGVLHETGHAMYEQNRPAEWQHQPVGMARGMAMHESQSLIVEMQAARSREFLSWLAPKLRAAFGGSGPAWESDNLVRLYTRVQRSFIRVDADEATYPAHVILRYELEQAMIRDQLAVGDLPGAWSEGMQKLLAIRPQGHAEGCLQDIHWPAGLFGYFPCYTLGAMTAAQLFDAATRTDGTILPALARGEFAPLMAWLKAHVHGMGSVMSGRDMLVKATGKPLDPAVFKAHLKRRYLDA